MNKAQGESTKYSKARGIIQDIFPSLLLLVGIIACWELITHVFNMHEVILPPPSRIIIVLTEKWSLLFDNMLFTLEEVAIGFVLGFSVGFILALLIVYSPVLEKALYPLVVASQTIPVFAIAPLLIIWFGFGIWPKVLIVALIVFFPVCVSEVEGLRSTETEMIDLLRSLSASRRNIFRLVQFPASLPYLMTGTQVGISYSVIGAVIGEWVGAVKGIGQLMLVSHAMSQTALVFAAIIVLSVVTMALFVSVSLVSRLLMPWKRFGS